MINTLDFYEDAKKQGFTHEQAEFLTYEVNRLSENKVAHTQLEDKQLSTKSDLITLQMELQKFMIKASLWIIGIISGLQTLIHFIPGK